MTLFTVWLLAGEKMRTCDHVVGVTKWVPFLSCFAELLTKTTFGAARHITALSPANTYFAYSMFLFKAATHLVSTHTGVFTCIVLSLDRVGVQHVTYRRLV